MTQERINKYFLTDFGEQLDVLYTTSDDCVFIRYEEALEHIEYMKNEETPLINDYITEWYSPMWI